MAVTRQQRLAELIAPFGEKYGLKSTEKGPAFEGFVADVLAGHYGIADPGADLGDALLRGNDMGVDIVLEDPDAPRLIIAQVKWVGRKTKGDFAPEAKGFFDLHSRLMQGAAEVHSNPEVQRLLGAYKDQYGQGGYSVDLYFVVSQVLEPGDPVRVAAEQKARSLEEAGERVACFVHDGNEIMGLHDVNAKASIGEIPDVMFKLQKGSYFEFDKPKATLVARISGNELLALYKDKKDMLFARNVRLPITSRINQRIKETVKDDPSDFFYFNNGVSATCSDFEVDDAGSAVTARRFQVINGAQTLRALKDSGGADGVFVLFRLTATKENTGGPFTEKVTRFNNSQNPVRDPDFRSNDPIQIVVEQLLLDRSAKGVLKDMSFWYERKRGQTAPKGRKAKKITKEEFGGSRHAFLYGPLASFRAPKNLWSDEPPDGIYWQAFGVDGERVTEWSEEQKAQAIVALAITRRQRDRYERLKADSRDSTDPPVDTLFLSRLARYVTGLVGVALSSAQGKVFTDWTELSGSHARFEEVVGPAEDAARRLIRMEYLDRREKGQVQPEYNLGRAEATWEKLSKMMRDEALDLYSS